MAHALLQMGVTLGTALQEDLPHPDYVAPPPWSEEKLHVTYITHTRKNSLTESDKQTINLHIDQLIQEQPPKTTLFTDGSVDQQTTVSACGFVTGETTAAYRLSNGASSMQTEMAAIWKALQHAADSEDNKDFIIITDSKSSIEALMQPVGCDNIKLHTSVLAALQQLHRQQRSVQLVWTPSHIGVEGNEAADRAANEGLALPRPTISVAQSISSIKA